MAMVNINFKSYIDWEKEAKEIMDYDYPDARRIDFRPIEIDYLIEDIINEVLLEYYNIPYSDADVPASVVEKVRKVVVKSLK